MSEVLVPVEQDEDYYPTEVSTVVRPVDDGSEHFEDWWPNAAKMLVLGLYADNDARDRAAEALLPLFERFRREPVEEVRTSDPIVARFGELLASKLAFQEQHLRAVHDNWSQQIQRCFERGALVRDELRSNLRELHAAALRLGYLFPTAEAHRLIEVHARHYAERTRAEADLQLRALRLECLHTPEQRRPTARHLDDELEHLVGVLPDDDARHTADRLVAVYAGHRRNAEHAAASQVLREVRRHWVHAL